MLMLTLMRIPKHFIKLLPVVILRQGTWEGGWIQPRPGIISLVNR
jgi:hypothetical protein